MDEASALAGQIWARRDYSQVAARLRPAALVLADTIGDGHGRRGLDLATATGSVALEMAHRGWAMSAVDACAPLLAIAAERADREDLVVDWRIAPLTRLPYKDGTFDRAVSSFGLIFSPDPAPTLRELRRCLKHDGRLYFTAWTPTGYMAQMAEAMARFLPATGLDPFVWGRPASVNGLLAECFDEIETATRTLPWHFPDARSAVEFYLTASPPHVAAEQTAGKAAGELRRAVEEHLAGLAAADGRVALAAEYLLVSARRR